MTKEKYTIIIPTEIFPQPSDKEVSAAYLLAKYFHKPIEFVPRRNQKTADFLIDGKYWELKSPTGTGKHNIQHSLQRAAEQSENVIFDARGSKIHMTKIRNEVKYQFGIIRKLKRVLLITKTEEVIEIFR